MDIPVSIIDYIMNTYHPDAVIVYGSFADGTATVHSDFDALVIADHPAGHDASQIGGTTLDVFVYLPETFRSDFDPEDYLQILDGIILLDNSGIAGQLQSQVQDYVKHLPQKSGEEIRQAVAWCEKMLSRTQRMDPEGCYRWHWLLCDSLQIYCDVMRQYYPGPKKALRRMAQGDAESFRIYSRALEEYDRNLLSEWIARLKELSATGQ